MADAVDRLVRFARSGHHTHWPDDVSILESSRFDVGQLTGHRQITDAYLLALAVDRGGALATFDRSVRTAAIRGFAPEHLVVLPALL